MKYLFYDVETANNTNRGSICAVGWLLTDEREIIDQGYSLINPHCRFSTSNINVHGIRPEDVADSPCYKDYFESTLCKYFYDAVIISHNAAFDISCTEQALFNAQIKDPGYDYFDSISLFKAYSDFPTYKLTSLSKAIGFEYSCHNAYEDALALYNVVIWFCDQMNFDSVSDFIIRSGCGCSNTQNNHYIPCPDNGNKEIPFRPSYSNEHCKDHVEAKDDLFSGLRFCITGDFPGYSRPDLERIIMEHGGRPTTSVSGKTNYVIVGYYEGFPADYISGKHKAALDLIASGGNIKILLPDDFLNMLHRNQEEK